MRMPLDLFPDNIVDHYNLRRKAKNGFVYMEIRKGMCGLPQARILVNKLLKNGSDTMATLNNPTRLAFGNMSVALYGSTSVSMILE
jgi:hypothetical protein